MNLIINLRAFLLACLCAATFASSASAQVCDVNNATNPENDCDRDGQTVGAGDCRDDDNTVKLGGVERCDGKDNDCDNQIDEGFDADGDGFKRCVDSCTASCDCDDTNNAIKPGATEQCDGVDQDCDGVADQNENITRNCYDGPAGTNNVGECRGGTQVCTGSTFGTCNNDVLPSAEVCDGKDNDCDASTDEGFDADGDGARDCGACGNSPGCDCNDNDATVRPGRTETCDGIDEDCDGLVDEGANGQPIAQSCYDAGQLIAGGQVGVGLCTRGTQVCNATLGSNVSSFGQCTGEGIGRAETCDGVDEDCGGAIDDGLTADADNDSVPSCASQCLRPPFSAQNCDCDDTRANVGSNDVDVGGGIFVDGLHEPPTATRSAALATTSPCSLAASPASASARAAHRRVTPLRGRAPPASASATATCAARPSNAICSTTTATAPSTKASSTTPTTTAFRNAAAAASCRHFPRRIATATTPTATFIPAETKSATASTTTATASSTKASMPTATAF